MSRDPGADDAPAIGGAEADTELLVRYLDGVAEGADVARLAVRLKTDGRVRADLVRLAHLQAMLHEISTELVPLQHGSRREHRPWLFRAAAGVGVAAALALGALLLWPSAAWPRIITVEGEVVIDRGSTVQPARIGSGLGSGDRIAAGAAAHLELGWRDGTRAVVDPGTRLTITPDAVVMLKLLAGTLHVVVGPHDSRHPFIVSTPDGIAADAGTVFRIARTSAGTRVEVQAGAIALSNATGEVLVKQGRSAAVRPGGAPVLLASRPPDIPDGIGWQVPAPQMPLVDPLPGLASASWGVLPADGATLMVAAPWAEVVQRGQPGTVIGQAPAPEMSGLRPELTGLAFLVLIDHQAQTGWLLREPELMRSGRFAARSLSSGPVPGMPTAPPLGCLFAPGDLAGAPAHAVAITLPAALRAESGLEPGDRLLLEAPTQVMADPATQRLLSLLTSHGAIVLEVDAAPSLMVDRRWTSAQQQSIQGALALLAPHLRRVLVEDAAGR